MDIIPDTRDANDAWTLENDYKNGRQTCCASYFLVPPAKFVLAMVPPPTTGIPYVFEEREQLKSYNFRVIYLDSLVFEFSAQRKQHRLLTEAQRDFTAKFKDRR